MTLDPNPQVPVPGPPDFEPAPVIPERNPSPNPAPVIPEPDPMPGSAPVIPEPDPSVTG